MQGALASGLVLALSLVVGLRAQGPARCGTPPFDGTVVEPNLPGDCAYSSTNPTSAYATTTVYRIPVVVHVLMSTAGAGYLSVDQVRSQVEVLNEDFRASAGTPGASGFDTGIEFFLATTDPAGRPTAGITYSFSNTWFLDGGSYWRTLAWDPRRYLNIYTNRQLAGTIGYVPQLPQQGIVGSTADRVVIDYRTFGRSAPLTPFDMGRTTTHEVGHYLGLFHTFEGMCDSGSCYSSGDRLCDTPGELLPNNGCGTKTSCGSPDPVNNYMNYSDDACMSEFASEQSRRMRCTLESWRPGLAQICPAASVAGRNPAGSSNPQSYTAAPPVLGTTFTATVDLTTTGHTSALVLGYAAPAQVAVAPGVFLLVDSGSSLRLVLPAIGVGLAQVSFPVPASQTLCGITIYTQAIHYGGLPGGALSNAQDLTFGS